MNVIEIFNSIEGEGIRQGFLATFIRLEGCNLRCTYCDSEYSFAGGRPMTVDEIVQSVESYGCPRVTITGGEPFLHDLRELCERLRDYEINIETNGSFPAIDLGPHVFYTMDYKLPSSGMEATMKEGIHLEALRPQDVLKFVAGTEEDLDVMLRIVRRFHHKCHLYVSPVFGAITAEDIVKFLQAHKVNDVRLQLQIHKYIWDPDAKGV